MTNRGVLLNRMTEYTSEGLTTGNGKPVAKIRQSRSNIASGFQGVDGVDEIKPKQYPMTTLAGAAQSV